MLSCAAAAPSAADLKTMQIFHIKEDDREQNNVAQSAVGKLQAKRLLEVVVKAKVTCSCFQGRFLTLRRPAKMTVEGGWRHRSSEHHGNRKEVLQKVIVA